ncbi:hypothetical protein U2P60_14165 [Brucella sp. H1_1004]|uniref:hypothetical protein n=1 Tax=Brucella sp. H1_1004 TaxID=3110109 RepID=UPI0039B6E2EF
MHDEIQFKTEVDCGFNLPAAYQAHNRKHDHMIAIASLIASVCVVTIVGAQIVGLV